MGGVIRLLPCLYALCANGWEGRFRRTKCELQAIVWLLIVVCYSACGEAVTPCCMYAIISANTVRTRVCVSASRGRACSSQRHRAQSSSKELYNCVLGLGWRLLERDPSPTPVLSTLVFCPFGRYVDQFSSKRVASAVTALPVAALARAAATHVLPARAQARPGCQRALPHWYLHVCLGEVRFCPLCMYARGNTVSLFLWVLHVYVSSRRLWDRVGRVGLLAGFCMCCVVRSW